MKITKTDIDTPTIFVIFGVTGDLAGRKLLPSLLNLYVTKRLPSRFTIVGFSRRHMSRVEFREFVREGMNIRPGQYHEEDIKHFLDHICYEQGNFDDTASYQRLSIRLSSMDDDWGQCSNKLFHLSVPPSLYESILDRLASSGLSTPCSDATGWTRILIEKPFGNDIETAKKLDKKLGQLFEESQIFRIDHYLAKEAMQNIIAFRFDNALFEPLWNRKHVDKIHIKLLEKGAVDGRGAFYDQTGALKDVGQNHILQMLALIAMEKPKTFDSINVRRERAKVLSRIIEISSKRIQKSVVRGQYEGYLQEKGVKAGSDTETYFRLESYINNPRWKGVPFFLESGKALAESRVEIDVYFKNGPDHDRQNILTFRIQPDEGIKIRFWVKTPGPMSTEDGMRSEAKTLKFKYSDSPTLQTLPDAYERVIHDAVIGDQTLFTSTDEVISAWKFISSILTHWRKVPLTIYPRGVKEV
jgi:glucose-6-phosphate 1-dehydrogenase